MMSPGAPAAAARSTASAPLRVVRVYSALDLGGIERQLCLLLPALKQRGVIEPSVILMRHEGPLAAVLREAGIHVEVVRTRGRFGKQAAGLLSQAFRRLNAQLVHAHAYEANATATLAAWLTGRLPTIAHYHTMESFSWRKRWQERLLNRMRRRVLVVADAVKRSYEAQVHPRAGLVELFPNAVPLPVLGDCIAARDAALARLHVPHGRAVLMAVGRLVPEKAPARLLAATRSLVERGLDAHLVLIGDGRLMESLRAEAERLGIGSRVTLAGRRDDVELLLPGADLFVSSSNVEGRSNAILEAMAAARPIVATDAGGTSELIKHGQTGVLVPPGDAEALVQALHSVLVDPMFSGALARGARTEAEQFDTARLLPRLEDMYRDAYGHIPHGGPDLGRSPKAP
ncbi:MAG: glycosyltransferase [Acidobacteriota bacterium]